MRRPIITDDLAAVLLLLVVFTPAYGLWSVWRALRRPS